MNLWNKFSLKSRLFLLMSLSIISIIGISTYGFFLNKKIDKFANIFSKKIIPEAILITEMASSMEKLSLYLWELESDGTKPENIERLPDADALIDEVIENYLLLGERLQESQSPMATLQANSISKLKGSKLKLSQLRSFYETNDHVKFNAIFADHFRPLLRELIANMQKISDAKTVERESEITLVYEYSSNANINIVLAAALGVLFVTLLSTIISLHLTKSLSSVTIRVANNSDQVSKMSQHIADTFNILSENTQQQALAIESTSASLIAVSNQVNGNTQDALSAKTLVVELEERSRNVMNTVASLNRTIDSLSKSNAKILNTFEVIHQIAEKTEVIDDIVFKTQLLSFNASVEAERAGENGRGFAVVAQEVGNLALVSGKAATEISAIIADSIKISNSVSTENKADIAVSENLIREANISLTEFIDSFKKIISITDNIVSSSQQQNRSITEVSDGMISLNTGTQSIVSKADDMSQASFAMAKQGQELISVVDELDTIVKGT